MNPLENYRMDTGYKNIAIVSTKHYGDETKTFPSLCQEKIETNNR